MIDTPNPGELWKSKSSKPNGQTLIQVNDEAYTFMPDDVVMIVSIEPSTYGAFIYNLLVNEKIISFAFHSNSSWNYWFKRVEQ